MELYNNMRELIEGEKNAGRIPANYCFEEAWLQYLQKFLAQPPLANSLIADACAAAELHTIDTYSLDRGLVQWDMYERLLGEFDNIRSKNRLTCPDLMTNFGYTLRILLRILEDDDVNPADRFGGNANPKNFELYAEGFKKVSALLQEDCSLKEAFAEFARASSMLGNYCCIPVKAGNENNLNPRKGGVRGNLAVFDETVCVNDQFALFAQWVDEYCKRDSTSKSDIDWIEKWKEKMLLKEVWGDYIEAADSYRKAFRDSNLEYFETYLNNVANAIKKRSESIVKEIDNAD